MRVPILLFVAAIALAASGSANSRSLGVPNDKGWQHANTGLVLMPKIGELQRESLDDLSTAELDVAARYLSADRATIATVYLYRPGVVSLPIWFDRSHYAMTIKEGTPVGEPMGSVTRFKAPGSSTESSLRIVYAIAGKSNASTGLAMAPMGNWLVAIRMTSYSKTPDVLDAALVVFANKIRWPANIPAAKVPSLIEACPSAMRFRRAKIIKPDLAQALIGAALSHSVNQGAGTEDVVYCRDGNSLADYSVYRPANGSQEYLLALGDAGIAARVAPTVSLDGRSGRYAVTLETHNSSDSYPNFSGLPEPKQVFALLNSSSPVSSASRGDDAITLTMPDKAK